MKPVAILIAGTHGFNDAWWHPGSEFVQTMEGELIRTADKSDPYEWDTKLDGIIGGNEVWETAGKALTWYARAKVGHYPISVVAHSHGGQVAAYAAANGLQIDRLVTVATPVRHDMEPLYRAATKNIGCWYHLHSDVDIWQILGGLFAGKWGIHREMEFADYNIMVPQVQHGEFLDVKLWNDNDWWSFLK